MKTLLLQLALVLTPFCMNEGLMMASGYVPPARTSPSHHRHRRHNPLPPPPPPRSILMMPSRGGRAGSRLLLLAAARGNTPVRKCGPAAGRPLVSLRPSQSRSCSLSERQRLVSRARYRGEILDDDDGDFDEESPHFSLKKLGEDEAMRILRSQPDLESIEALLAEDGGVGEILCFAAARGYLRMIDFLAEKGANINYRKDDFSMAPLAHAVVKGHPECAATLIDYGARVHNIGIDPRYMVTFAIQSGDTGLFHRLVTEGVDIHKAYKFGDFERRTQLDVAVDIGAEGFAELLLDLGVDPHAGRGMPWLFSRCRELDLDQMIKRLEEYSQESHGKPPQPKYEIPKAGLRRAVPLPEDEQEKETDPKQEALEERLKWEKLMDEVYDKWQKGEDTTVYDSKLAQEGLTFQLVDADFDDDFEDEADTAVAPFWSKATPADILVNPSEDTSIPRGNGISFDLDDAMDGAPRGGFIRGGSPLGSNADYDGETVFRTPEVRRAMDVLGLDPDQEFTSDDVVAQFRIMQSMHKDDKSTMRRLNIARDFLMGKLMDLY